MSARKWSRIARRVVGLLAVAVVLTSCGSWRGIANVALPGGPGTGSDKMTVYVQMPDTLALNVNSRVRVADVYVGPGALDRAEELGADADAGPGARTSSLPENALAKIGQTSLLGTQHVQLDPPPNPSPQLLKNGDTIPLKNSSAFPTTERVLASIATIVRGGGIPNIDVIQTEVNNLLTGRADQIREFLNRLDTFTDQLNQQRNDITRAIDSTNKLLTIVGQRNATLDRVLTEFPPLIKYFADTRDLFADAVVSLGRISNAADAALSRRAPTCTPTCRTCSARSSSWPRRRPMSCQALKLLLTAPFSIENVPKVVRGDYINMSANFDLTLSSLDQGFLTGTGVSGMLRALEQAWGRDPETMIPDLRFTPNPHDAPGRTACGKG